MTEQCQLWMAITRKCCCLPMAPLLLQLLVEIPHERAIVGKTRQVVESELTASSGLCGEFISSEDEGKGGDNDNVVEKDDDSCEVSGGTGGGEQSMIIIHCLVLRLVVVGFMMMMMTLMVCMGSPVVPNLLQCYPQMC